MVFVIKVGLIHDGRYFVGWSEDSDRDQTWSTHQESGMRFDDAATARELLPEIANEDARPVKLRSKKVA